MLVYFTLLALSLHLKLVSAWDLKLVSAWDLFSFSPETLLLRSLVANDGLGVKEALRDGANPDEAVVTLTNVVGVRDFNYVGWPAIHIAAHISVDMTLITPLKDAGANLELQNSFGDTPICTAVLGRNYASVKLLIERGANVKVSCHVNAGQGCPFSSTLRLTALGTAILHDSVHIASMLVEAGARIDDTQDERNDTVGMTSLASIAAASTSCGGTAANATALIRAGADVSKILLVGSLNEVSPLHNSRNRLPAPLHQTLKRLQCANRTSLCLAIQYSDNVELIHTLIHASPDSPEFGYSPPLLSFLLLRPSAEPKIANILIANGLNINTRVNGLSENSATLLMAFLSTAEKSSIATQLINAGADVNARTKTCTPLMIAALANTAAVKELVMAGANVNARAGGWDWDLNSLNSRHIDNLIDDEIDNAISGVNDAFYKVLPGGTALHYAAIAGNLEAIDSLLVAGAEIDAVTEIGASALRLAMMQGYNVESSVTNAEYYKIAARLLVQGATVYSTFPSHLNVKNLLEQVCDDLLTSFGGMIGLGIDVDKLPSKNDILHGVDITERLGKLSSGLRQVTTLVSSTVVEGVRKGFQFSEAGEVAMGKWQTRINSCDTKLRPFAIYKTDFKGGSGDNTHKEL